MRPLLSAAMLIATSASAAEFQHVQVYQSDQSLIVRADVVPPTPYNILHGYGVQLAFKEGGISYPWFMRAPTVGNGLSEGLVLFHNGELVATISAVTVPESLHVEIPLEALGFPAHLDWQVRRTADVGDVFSDGVWQIEKGSIDFPEFAPVPVNRSTWGGVKARWR
jgi:hypothetical protein